MPSECGASGSISRFSVRMWVTGMTKYGTTPEVRMTLAGARKGTPPVALVPAAANAAPQNLPTRLVSKLDHRARRVHLHFSPRCVTANTYGLTNR